MIKIVYGPKGFGKTKIMLDEVNASVEKAKGNIVFITDKRFDTSKININVRCTYTEEHDINNSQCFTGFVNGLMAGNSDIEYVFIDGLKRIIGEDLRGAKNLFRALRKLQKEYKQLKFIVSVSATKEQLPSYIARYVK